MKKLRPQQEIFDFQSTYHFSEKPFHLSDTNTRDHLQLTREYRGSNHQSCTVNYNDSYAITQIFHNLSGYNSQFIVKSLATKIKGNVSLLRGKRYISYTKYIENTNVNFSFLDSFRFTASGLDKLANLNDQLNIIKQFCRTSH